VWYKNRLADSPSVHCRERHEAAYSFYYNRTQPETICMVSVASTSGFATDPREAMLTPPRQMR